MIFKGKSRERIILCLLAFAASVFYIIMGISDQIKYKAIEEKCTASTMGTIVTSQKAVRNDMGDRGDGNNTVSYRYHAIIEFEVKGKTYIAEDLTGSTKEPTVGALTEVVYDPENPSLCSKKGPVPGLSKRLIIGLCLLVVTPIILVANKSRT